jgi:hypothetical protein
MPLGLAAFVVWLVAASMGADEQHPVALGSGRVVVAPVNLAVRAVSEVEPGVEPVWRALLQYFTSDEKPAIALDPNDASALWNEVMANARKSGREADLFAAYAEFARRVGEQSEFGNIVFPTLVLHSARVHGRVANWDGVHRQIEIPGQAAESIDTYRDGKIWVKRDGASGELAAASLHIAVFSPRGEFRYQGIGGLVLLQKLVEPRKRKGGVELTAVMRSDAFTAPDELHEGIGAALHDWPSATASIAR